jgi:hypothetical protein
MSRLGRPAGLSRRELIVWRDFRPSHEKLVIGAKDVLESCHGVIVLAQETKGDPSAGGIGNPWR